MRDYISITIHCEGLSELISQYSFYYEPDTPFTRLEMTYRVCALLHTTALDGIDDDNPLKEQLNELHSHVNEKLAAIVWLPEDILPTAFAIVEGTSDLIVIFEDDT